MTFGETQSKDLKDLKLEVGTLLQYVGEILITRTSFQQCLTITICCVPEKQPQDKSPLEKRGETIQRTVLI